MPQPASSARTLEFSGIREIVDLVLGGGREVARLEVGEPGFDPAQHIVEAAIRAARGPNRYTQSAGVLALREEISASLGRRYGVEIPVDRVVVSQGAGQGISAVMTATLAPGDEVLIPDPAWPNYVMLARLLGAVPRRYSLRAENGFQPDPDEIEGLVTERTRMILVNSPGNPTGAVVPRATLERIIDVAVRHDLLLVSDEVYDELIFSGEPTMAASLAPEHAVSVFSFSKTYAMTGWRVGYVVAPAWLGPLLGHVQEPLLSCISSVSQAAALAALTGPQDAVAAMRESYRVRRDLVVGLLAREGIDVDPPAGAFYLMAPLPPGVASRTAAFELVDRGVATAPGSAFGTVAEGFLRLSLASPEDALVDGVGRLVAWRRDRLEVAG